MYFNLPVLVMELEGTLGDAISSVKKLLPKETMIEIVIWDDPFISVTQLRNNAAAENRRSSGFNIMYRCSALRISWVIG